MYFVVVDKYGSVVSTESKAKLYIRYISQGPLTFYSVVTKVNSTFATSIESETQLQCHKGLFSVDDFVFVGEPNSNQCKP